MSNLMDRANYNMAPVQNNVQNIDTLVDQIRQNPAAFEEYIRTTNPQAYQMALQVRNMPNPKAMVAQMAQARGVNPNILRMFGIF